VLAGIEQRVKIRNEVEQDEMGTNTTGNIDQGGEFVTTQDQNTPRQSRFAEALNYLKTEYSVRHLLVATIVFLLAFAILMIL
jgi:hypothetical protein